jgi:hypothetical protein
LKENERQKKAGQRETEESHRIRDRRKGERARQRKTMIVRDRRQTEYERHKKTEKKRHKKAERVRDIRKTKDIEGETEERQREGIGLKTGNERENKDATPRR